MKKVLIVTIFDAVPNYGNKLQNYASKKVLEKMGAQVSTLITEPQPSILVTYIKLIVNRLSGYHLRDRLTHSKWKKIIKFHNFDKKNLKPDASFIKGNFNPEKYDYFAVGSDQVWNPEWYDIYPPKKDLFLLTFANPSQMICMSPSFGIEDIPQKWESWFKEKLVRFPKLAVREKSGVSIIEKLTGLSAQQIIDPTLLLGKEEWQRLAFKPKFINADEKYILTYFLGEKSSHISGNIKAIANENGYKIFHLNDISDKRLYTVGPEEFIYLIWKSELILTDSFHACVFSFIFERPFEVFARQSAHGNMMSRINTLLSTFHLERKYANSGLENDIWEHDYTEGYKQLEIERQKAFDFLRESLED